MAAEEEYESVLCVKPAVLVYRVPPRASNRGYRAAEWQLDQPAWSGRLRITAKGSTAFIKLEDKSSGELFAQAPVEQFPGIAVEGVTDSSRYFVIRIEDGNGASRTPADPAEPSLLLFGKDSCFPWRNVPCTVGAERGAASLPRL